MMKYYLIFLYTINLFAAGPITHAYFAQEWQGNEEFIRGTLFPDIRYLGVISREETHEANLALEDIQNSPTPFIAGKRLHAYLDEKREEFVVVQGIYNRLDYPYKATLLKLIEDEILFDQLDRTQVILALQSISSEELIIPLEDIQRWHQYLTLCFTFKPSEILCLLALQNKGLFNIPAETVILWSQLIPSLAKEREFQVYVERLKTLL